VAALTASPTKFARVRVASSCLPAAKQLTGDKQTEDKDHDAKRKYPPIVKRTPQSAAKEIGHDKAGDQHQQKSSTATGLASAEDLRHDSPRFFFVGI